MKVPNTGIGRAASCGLQLPSEEDLRKRLEQEATKTRKRRKYWQDYKSRMRRVFGTISPKDHEDLLDRAENSGRPPFQQLWAESQAYLRGERVLTLNEAEQKRLMVSEMRRIGNNINQLAKLGHIEARKHGGLTATSGDRIGTEVLRQFTRLERLVTKFADGTTISVSLSENQDPE